MDVGKGREHDCKDAGGSATQEAKAEERKPRSSFRRRPESSGFKDFLDTAVRRIGLRRDDGVKLVPFGFDRLNLCVAMLSNCDDPPQLVRGINGQFSIFVIFCISGYEPFNFTTFTRIILKSIFKIIKCRIHR